MNLEIIGKIKTKNQIQKLRYKNKIYKIIKVYPIMMIEYFNYNRR